MWFFKHKKVKNLAVDPFYREGNTLVAYFKCAKCGEYFRSHLRVGYDFINDYDNPSTPYRLDKIYVGSKCPNKLHLTAAFSASYKVRSFSLEGGEFVTREEYEQHTKEAEK